MDRGCPNDRGVVGPGPVQRGGHPSRKRPVTSRGDRRRRRVAAAPLASLPPEPGATVADRPLDDPDDIDQLRRDNERLRAELAALRASRSWRLGHGLVRVARRLTGRGAAPDPGRGAATSGPATPRPPVDRPAVGPVPPGPAAARPASEPPRSRRREEVTLDATEVAADRLPHLVATVRASLGTTPLRVLHADAPPLDVPRVRVERPDGQADLLDGTGPRLVAVGPDGLDAVVGPAPRPLVQVIDAVPDDVVAELPAGPILVGGTGRSGTWVLGRLFGIHPRWSTIRTELRFHASAPGFPAVLDGEVSPRDFAALVRDRWLRATGGTGGAKGLQVVAAKHEVRACLTRFERRATHDLEGALGQLLLDVTGPWARGRGAIGWCETTPDNAAAAPALTRVLPTCRVVHVVRDGRDVAASVVTQPWGPADLDEALDWWVQRLRAAHAGIAASPAEQVHTVRLEELVHVDRDGGFEALCDAVGFADRGPLRTYFDRRISADAGNVGRWRRHLDGAERARFDARYRRELEQLAADGVTLPTAPDVVDEIGG
ncbi:sulfotransferase [Nitriliruptoraceae bacterium ZYF776]|nr:sulfotransferase [Profundirhabdus halotolerans]